MFSVNSANNFKLMWAEKLYILQEAGISTDSVQSPISILKHKNNQLNCSRARVLQIDAFGFRVSALAATHLSRKSKPAMNFKNKTKMMPLGLEMLGLDKS